ncbi:MAG: hypothetical protein JXR31_12150 [Prolixibacteraceae bacterium]|nr:hypothetical protein [Prolixibacteraceae bacterium]
MKNNLLSEKELHAFFEYDSKGVSAHSSVKSRLLYYFSIKSANYKIRQNSFAEMLGWLFSFRNLSVKATLASLIVVFSLIKFQGNSPSSGQFLIDSMAHDTKAYADSAMLLPFDKDTCFLKF